MISRRVAGLGRGNGALVGAVLWVIFSASVWAASGPPTATPERKAIATPAPVAPRATPLPSRAPLAPATVPRAPKVPGSAPKSAPVQAREPAVIAEKPRTQVPAAQAKVSSPVVLSPATVATRSGAHPEFADAWPSNLPAAADLSLRPDEQRRADALVAFSGALVADDNADTEKSLEGYRKVLELDPGYTELAVKVAYELARQNDVSGGIQVLKDAVKAAPKEALPLIYLSQLYAKQLKKSDLALKCAEQALALAPDSFAAYLANFELYIAANDPKKAEAVLEKAAKTNSTDAKFWIQLGDLYTRLYLKEDGASQPEQRARMNAIYRKAAALVPADPTILSKVGDYFVLSRQVKEAIPFYLKVIGLPQTEKDPPLNNTREKLARAFLVTQQRNEAIATLEQIGRDNPMRFDTFELLGEIYEQKGEHEKALHNFEHSLLLDASQPQNYLRLTDMLLRTKNADKAVETMQQARARFPDLPQITFTLAVALSQAKRHTDAMTTFAVALADSENSHEELLNATFYFQYGAAAEQAGLTEKAADLLKQCISLDPGNAAQAYNYLGYMWADRGENLEEAAEMIKKAMEMEPDNGAYIDSLGWLYFKKGEHEKALKELLRASETIKPEDAVVFDHLADTYHALGRTAEALSFWQKALSLSADDKAAAGKLAEKIDAAKQKVTSSTAPMPKVDAPAPAN